MSNDSYLNHRAAKQLAPTRFELRLLDLDLAAAGVQLSWSPILRADAQTRVLVLRVVRDVLRAA